LHAETTIACFDRLQFDAVLLMSDRCINERPLHLDIEGLSE